MTQAERTPRQVADYDQAHAAVSASLDTLVNNYRAMLASGEPRDLTVAGQGEFLRSNMTADALAEHLTIAIERLASQEQP